MKLATFVYGSEERLGAVDGAGRMLDLRRAYASYLRDVESNPSAEDLAELTLGRDMVELLRRGADGLEAARKALAYGDANPSAVEGQAFDVEKIRLMAPVPRPGALVSAGKNFSDHVAEMASKKGPSAPVAFLKLPGTVIGPEDDIPHPPEVKNLDYEVELAIIIGKPCADVTEDQALDYVAGYSAFNDISARDVIRGENKTGIHLMGKSFPGFAPMGPYLVTADEIPDPQNLKLRLSVNGETRQDSSLSYMIFKIREMIAYWSQMGLNPGDVLTTGTPRGVAAGRKPGEPPWWLKPGDIIEAEVERVGRLRNRIVAESALTQGRSGDGQ
jgi:acylpyruvate hydrolase